MAGVWRLVAEGWWLVAGGWQVAGGKWPGVSKWSASGCDEGIAACLRLRGCINTCDGLQRGQQLRLCVQVARRDEHLCKARAARYIAA